MPFAPTNYFMDDSYTLIKRFTPPTCTLEIWGKNLALSRWKKQIGLKDIQFKLSFDDPRNLDSEPVIVKGDRNFLEKIYSVVLSYTENFLAKSFLNLPFTLVSQNSDRFINPQQPYLVDRGLVKQEFNLNNLTEKTEQQIVSLSATQLFDLVDALEAYHTEMAALAELEIEQQKKSQKLVNRAVRVTGIFLALGLTTIGIKVANRGEKRERVVTDRETDSLVIPPVPKQDVIAPEVPETAEKPTAKSEANETLSSTEILPPPPAVDTPKPPPDIPDPALYPPTGNLIIPPLANNQQEKDRQELANSNSENNDTRVESQIVITPESYSEQKSQSEVNIELEKVENNSLAEKEASEIQITDNKSEEQKKLEPEYASEPREIASNDLLEKPTTGESVTEKNDSQSKIPEVPQLQEINTYFQQKWRSPSDLRQTLEYRLTIAKDGSIQRILPIGKAAKIYLDRTNIPLMGESFVSPLIDRDRVIIRLLLSPDDDVRTFLE